MPPFRFRAAAALDLRQREENAAALELARKEAEFRKAEASTAAAEAARSQALEDQHSQAGRGIDMATLFWHRNWIIRLQATVVDLRAEQRAALTALDAAKRAWQMARQRRLTLERMRDRALIRHRASEHRQELKVIDELARVRFTTQGEADG
jgi:flagellar export protein FliJ